MKRNIIELRGTLQIRDLTYKIKGSYALVNDERLVKLDIAKGNLRYRAAVSLKANLNEYSFDK